MPFLYMLCFSDLLSEFDSFCDYLSFNQEHYFSHLCTSNLLKAMLRVISMSLSGFVFCFLKYWVFFVDFLYFMALSVYFFYLLTLGFCIVLCESLYDLEIVK